MSPYYKQVKGYYCRKCGGRETAMSPSGMLVLCMRCPWTEAYPMDLCMALAQTEEDQRLTGEAVTWADLSKLIHDTMSQQGK